MNIHQQNKESILNNSINNIINSNSNYNDLEVLFWKVWKNKIIRKNIITHLIIFKQHRIGRYYSLDEIYNDQFLDYIEIFEYYGDIRLPKYLIPESVESVNFGYGYNKKIDVDVLPHSVKKVKIGQSFNQELQLNQIPSSVTSLSFGCYFNNCCKPLSIGVIPNSVTYLEFGGYFDQLLEPGIIPSSVLSLSLASYLPYSGYYKPLFTGSIPSSVTNLNISFHKQELVREIIPSSVTILKISGSISVPKFDNQPVWGGPIPDSVTELTLGNCFRVSPQVKFIPPSVTTLNCLSLSSITFGSIPSSVINLTLDDQYSVNQHSKPIVLCKYIDSEESSELDTLSTYKQAASTITSYFKSYFFNSSASHKLKSKNCNKLIESIIPPSVRVLKYNINQLILEGTIPTSVTKLSFGDYFNQPIKLKEIPSSVTSLSFGDQFNQPILESGIIPSSVTSLSFGEVFDQNLKNGIIPSSVTYLKLGHKFSNKLIHGSIPSSVTHLVFNKYFNRPLTLDEVGDIPFSTISTLEFSDHFGIENLNLDLLNHSKNNILVIIGKSKYKIINNDLTKI